MQWIKKINYAGSHSQHPDINQRTKEIKNINEKLITGIPEYLSKPLMLRV